MLQLRGMNAAANPNHMALIARRKVHSPQD